MKSKYFPFIATYYILLTGFWIRWRHYQLINAINDKDKDNLKTHDECWKYSLFLQLVLIVFIFWFVALVVVSTTIFEWVTSARLQQYLYMIFWDPYLLFILKRILTFQWKIAIYTFSRTLAMGLLFFLGISWGRIYLIIFAHGISAVCAWFAHQHFICM